MSNQVSPSTVCTTPSPRTGGAQISPAVLGKVRRNIAVSSGELQAHPFLTKRFQPKRQQSRIVNRILPGSPLEGEFLEECKTYLEWLLPRGCHHKRNRKQGISKCTCLSEVPAGRIVKLARCQLSWFTQTKECREARLIEWLKGAWEKRASRKRKIKEGERKYNSGSRSRWYGRKFILAQFDETDDEGVVKYSPYHVCQNALLSFYNISYETWKKLEQVVSQGGDRGPTHMLLGRKSNSSLKGETFAKLMSYFKNLQENKGEPHATKVIRTRLRVALRNNDDIVELPSSYTKRQLYAKFLFECGWLVKPKGNGSFGPMSEYTIRLDSEEWTEADNGRIPPCSFETFRQLWSSKFPKLRIRSPSYDTCTTCFKYCNNLSAITRQANLQCIVLKDIDLDDQEGGEDIDVTQDLDNELVQMNESSDEESSDEESDSSLNSNTSESVEEQTEEENSDNENQTLECELNLRHEAIIIEMGKHTDAWMAQRTYVQKNAAEAKNDLENNVTWPNRHDCAVGDYCQNLGMPHFGGEQPGDTYYFSPLTINVFGICDYATKHLNAYVYTEAEGKKGGNNVASLVHKFLTQKGVFDDAKKYGPGKCLSLVFNNCGGQNKNRMVLRYILYLVEIKVYKTVEIIFLVCGHTKNICDRLFKELKRDFHHKNIYNIDHMLCALNISRQVTSMLVTSKDFFNLDNFFDKVYKRPAPGTVNKNHIFIASMDTPGILVTEAVHGVDRTEQNLTRLSKKATGQQRGGRTRTVKNCKLELEKRPGVQPIK